MMNDSDHNDDLRAWLTDIGLDPSQILRGSINIHNRADLTTDITYSVRELDSNGKTILNLNTGQVASKPMILRGAKSFNLWLYEKEHGAKDA